MHLPSVFSYAPDVLAAVFAIAGLVYLSAPWVLEKIHARWSYAHRSGRLIGVLDLMTALFLAVPETRIWGVALGAFILFGAAVMLLGHRRYWPAVPTIVLLAALPLALAGGPF